MNENILQVSYCQYAIILAKNTYVLKEKHRCFVTKIRVFLSKNRDAFFE